MKKLKKEYLEYLNKKTKLKPTTRKDQEIILKNFPPIGKLNAAYFRSLMKKKKDSGEDKYSAFTIWKRYGLAKRVLEFHGIEHDLDTLKKDDLPSLHDKEPVTQKDLYTSDELKRMFAACKNSRDRALLEMLYESAARASELISLQVEDIKFGNDPNNGPHYSITVVGKTGTRTIPMGHSVVALRALLNVHPLLKDRSRDDYKGPLFVSATGTHRQIIRNHLYLIVKAALEDAGITGKRKIVHMFRHTRATELVKLGVRGQALSKFMGWTKKSDMEATYIHLSTADMENEIAEKVYGRPVIEKRGQLVETKMCPSCNQDMLDMGAVFCPVCGFPLTEEGVKKSEQRADKLEVRVTELEGYIRGAVSGNLTQEWLNILTFFKEAPMEEQERINREILAIIASSPEMSARLDREADEIEETERRRKKEAR